MAFNISGRRDVSHLALELGCHKGYNEDDLFSVVGDWYVAEDVRFGSSLVHTLFLF